MTTLQAWLVAGATTFGGIAVLVWWLTPAQPHLADVVAQLSPNGRRTVELVRPDTPDLADRLGWWAVRHLPAGVRGKVPDADLAVLGTSVHVFYGEKLLFVGIAAVAVPLLSMLVSLTVELPLVAPVGLTLIAVALAWFLPNQNVADAANRARAEFVRALGAYVDLVALERNAGGSGTRQALENAAAIGDSWPFRRLADELARSRFAGVAPWDGLAALAEELRIAELDDLADIMRLAGEEGAQVYETLRSRSSALRNAILSTERSRANALGERMVIPTTAMAMVLVATFLTPAVLRLVAG